MAGQTGQSQKRGEQSREGGQEGEKEDRAEARSSRRRNALGRVGPVAFLKDGDVGESGGGLRRGGGKVFPSAEGDQEEQKRRDAFHASEGGLGKY